MDGDAMPGDVAVESCEDEFERASNVLGAPTGCHAENSYGFAVEGTTADCPVERVLEGSGNAERVFRDGEQYRVRALAGFAKPSHGVRRPGFQVRVELRQSRDRLGEIDAKTSARRRSGGGAQGGAVEGFAPQASGDREDHDPSRSTFRPAGDTTYQPAPKSWRSWPFVCPRLVSWTKR